MSECYAENRSAIGKRSGFIGLIGNIILVMIKASVGFLSNSVAITADALNNLSDCASSVITLLGFSLAARGKDKTHPYGHGRMEYICGFLISLIILFTGVTAGIDAFKRLLNPRQITVSILTIAALFIGITGKVFMAWYVKRLNKKVSSTALDAVQRDNFSDALITAATLIGILTVPYTGIPVDGILGLIISAMILKSGVSGFSENFVLLLGEGADPKTKDEIMRIVTEYIPVDSVKEIALHDYGPENRLVFIKILPPSAGNDRQVPQYLEAIKDTIQERLQIDATLYWDLSDQHI